MGRQTIVVALLLAFGCGDNRAPVFLAATQLADTHDSDGPYPVKAMVIDDEGVARVEVLYRVDPATDFTRSALLRVDDDRWQGAIPGQPVGSTIRYYYEAFDGEGRRAVAPEGGTQGGWLFRVVPREEGDGGFPQEDGGGTDGGAADGGPMDGGAQDGGALDGGAPDGGRDGGVSDGGSRDGGADGGLPDGGLPRMEAFPWTAAQMEGFPSTVGWMGVCGPTAGFRMAVLSRLAPAMPIARRITAAI
jgi:hypothetical protein